MIQAKPAATVMVCREMDGRIELLMVKRSHRAGFFPSAWVFPGGRLDAADHDAPVVGDAPNSNCPHYVVAAVRECFEESGVWLGEGSPAQDFREKLNSRKATLADAPTLKADLSRMAQWSWWITPEAEPKRYDTRFFLTCLSPLESSLASPDNSETVESTWISPKEAIGRHYAGDFYLAPPTLLTLVEIGGFENISTLWQSACNRRVEAIVPLHRKSMGLLEILLPGHSDHPDKTPLLQTTRLTLQSEVWHLD